MLLHFKRIAGTLDELSYAPCGAGVASFADRTKNATSVPADVTCAACRRWLREMGRLP